MSSNKNVVSVLTISVDVHSAGVAFAVVVCVCLIRVAIVRTVVTTVTHIVPVIIILPGVVDKRTIVLFQKREERRKVGGNETWRSGVALSIP